MNEQETIADIIAWLRRPREGENGYLTAWRDEIADRLESAHKRERGDCAKLREALNLCVDEMCARCRDLAKARGNPAPCLNGCEPVRKAKAALAAPPRNCDVGTAEEQEKRFHDFCRARHLPRMEVSSYCAYKCPLEGDTCCELQWAQMPYVEKEGGAK